MSTNSRRANKSKRLRTEVNAAEESSFTDISIPLSLSSSQQIPSDDSVLSPSSFNLESHQLEHECGHEILEMPHPPNESADESFNENELELDSMWNEVFHTLVAQTDERELRDWEMTMSEEDDSDFEEVRDEMTLTETADPLLGVGVDLDDQRSSESSGQTDAGKTSSENQILYPGARVTIGGVMVLLTLFAIKYDLTGEAITHLLQLITLILPSGNILPDTLKKFKAYFRKLDNPFIVHHYCAFCLSYVDKQATFCPNTACLKELSARHAKAYFIEIPIVQQLATFFSRSGFYSSIQHRFQREKKNRNNVEDIYDGLLYKKLASEGILSSPDNLSFLMNTDGVPVFKSSKVSIWPLYLIINELPYHKRMANENMIFAGLWFGEKKPAMWTFLKPHTHSFAFLEKGVEMESPERGKFQCKGILLSCTCDLPARCLLCNSMQYNGEHGCWKCLQPGQTVRTGVRGHSRAFLYQPDDPKGPLRTSEGVKEDGIRAATLQQQGVNRSIVNGVKGPSWLSALRYFDLVSGMAIDYMHGVLLGVQKLLLTLWFSSKFSNRHFSISSKVDSIDFRLSQILPTSEIKRLPRSIAEHLKYWKASELRSFLLYYGLPTLYGLLPDRYFAHYTLFVQAIYILLQDSISEADLQEADRLLDGFCKSFSALYEERFYTLNVHQLLHLVDNVRDLGPLYTHSCFSFEDKNGFILKLIHGTQFIDNQILSAVALTQKLPELKEKCVPSGSEIDLLYQDLTRAKKYKFRTEILPNIHVLSATYQVCLSVTEMNALEKFLGSSCPLDRLWAFNRLEVTATSSVICGLAYKRMRKRNCAVVKYAADNTWAFAMVKFFINYNLSSSREPMYLAVAHPILCDTYNPKLPINRVTPCNHEQTVVFNVLTISSNCLYISFTTEENQDDAYVCEFPNKKEHD